MPATKVRYIVFSANGIEISNRTHYHLYKRVRRSSWNKLLYVIRKYGYVHEEPYPVSAERTPAVSWYLFAVVDL